VPRTLVVAPGLVADKVYVGYWFWGRPSPFQLWQDLQDLLRRTKKDLCRGPVPRGRHHQRPRPPEPPGREGRQMNTFDVVEPSLGGGGHA
jgi:hypothetical protein